MNGQTKKYDIVIIRGTSAGVAAALQVVEWASPVTS